MPSYRHVNEQFGSDRATPSEVTCIEDIPYDLQKKYKNVQTVGVSVKVISIASINTVESTYLADLNVNVCWIGEKDAGPQIQIYNMVEQLEYEQVPPPQELRDDQNDGRSSDIKCFGKKASNDGATDWSWYYRIRIRGILRQDYDMRRFPFDTQCLTVCVRMKSACKLTPVYWGLNGEAAICAPSCILGEFHLEDAEIEHAYMPSFKFGSLDGFDPEVRVKFTVARSPTYWITSYGVAASFICSLIGVVYSIPVEAVADRLGVATTLVLTMCATKFLMCDKMPPTSYFTILDIHLEICGAFLLVLTVSVGLTKFVGEERMEMFESTYIPWFFGAWAVYHVICALCIAGFYLGFFHEKKGADGAEDESRLGG